MYWSGRSELGSSVLARCILGGFQLRHLDPSGNDFGVRFYVSRVNRKVAFQRDIIQKVNLFYSIDCISMLLVGFNPGHRDIEDGLLSE
jgi:hypothetical protein